MRTKQTIIYETRSDQHFLKTLNIKKILNLLWIHNRLSRLELAEFSQLNKKTITNITTELLEHEVIRTCGYKNSSGGRRQQLLEINAERSYHMGIDLGATHIYGVVINFRGNIIVEKNIELRVNTDPSIIIRMIINMIHELIHQSGLKRSNIFSLGFAVPGFIDREKGVSLLSENIPGWKQVPVRDILAAELDVPIYIEDSSRTMTLTEYWFGAGRKTGNYIVFDLGYGIGCGIFIDGNLYMGANFKSGEIGHTIVKPNGPICICGHRGCIESIASGKAIAQIAIAELKKHQKSLLNQLIGENIEGITASDIVMASELGDSLSIKILREAGKYIAVGITNALHFFNPSLIILGGRLMQSGHILFDTIDEFLRMNSMTEIYADVKVVRSQMGPSSAALGAALLHLQEFFSFY